MAVAERWAKRCDVEGVGLGRAVPRNLDIVTHTRCVTAQLKTQKQRTFKATAPAPASTPRN